MQVKEVRFKYSRPDIFQIIPFGDCHLGTVHCCEDEIQKKVKQIQNTENCYFVGMGDYMECITPKDPRWDGSGIAGWVHDDNIAYDQTNRLCEILAPIKDKCLGLLEGNHEDAIKKHNHDNVQRVICEKLGVTNLGYSCFIKFIFIRSKSHNEQYIGYFTHGAGCAVTAGAKLTRLQRTMDNFEADIIAHAHVHDVLTYVKPYLMLNSANQVKSRVKVAAMTGCYFRTYTQGESSSYGEIKSYPPTTLGSPTFTIIPDKGILKVNN